MEKVGSLNRRQCFAKKGTRKRSGFPETEAKSDESNKIPKTKHACIVEARESTRQRLELPLPKDHEDHIAGKGYNSMTHYNLAHKFIPMLQAMEILDAESAVDKEWKELEAVPAWQLDKVKSKKRGYSGSTRREKKSPLCYTDGHLSSQMRSWIPKFRNVKDESFSEVTL